MIFTGLGGRGSEMLETIPDEEEESAEFSLNLNGGWYERESRSFERTFGLANSVKFRQDSVFVRAKELKPRE
jgi:hypothetical protein